MQQKACHAEKNTKMPTRTKSVEESKIVSKSEIHLHLCLNESRGFKIRRNNHQGCSIKKSFIENSAKLTENHLRPSSTRVFYCQFYEIFENTFLTELFRATAFDEEA